MAEHLPSLDLIAAEARAERKALARHADALDAKAGIVLGFAGALVALSSGYGSTVADVGRIVAAVAAGFGLLAFWPRSFLVLKTRPLRDGYLTSDARFTRLRLLDTYVDMTDDMHRHLNRKARDARLVDGHPRHSDGRLGDGQYPRVSEKEDPMDNQGREPPEDEAREWPEPPPFQPDPELIGHMENNRREIKRAREHAQRSLDEAKRKARRD